MLALAATDMELSLRATVEADVAGEGIVVVPGRLLLDIARALPEAEVSLEHLAEESVRADHERFGELPHPHLLGRGLPASARARGRLAA